MLKPFLAVLALAAGLAAAAAADAATVCAGEAKGPANSSVTVTLELDGAGKPVSRRVMWTPPSDGASPFPMAIIGYEPGAASLDRPANLAVAAMAPLQPMPASATASVEVSVEGRSFRLPWRMYPGMIAGARKDKSGADRKPVMIWGMVPVAFDMADKPKTNPELLALMASARRMEVRIEGDAPGELFGRASFDLSDPKARDALYADAAAQAEAAARTPKTCGKQ